MITDDSTMLFGKHIGKPIKEVPHSYLLYIYHNNIARGDLRIYINNQLSVLNAQAAINTKNRFFDKKYYLQSIRRR